MKAFIFLIAAVLFFNTSTFAQQKDSIQAAELVQLSKTWMNAMMQHDSSKLENMMAAEYNLKKGDGTIVMERAGWLNNLFHNLNIVRFEQSGISAQVYGNVGIVTSFYSWAGTMRNSPFDSKGYITDVWLKRNNRWQVISRTAATFPGSNTLEGK